MLCFSQKPCLPVLRALSAHSPPFPGAHNGESSAIFSLFFGEVCLLAGVSTSLVHHHGDGAVEAAGHSLIQARVKKGAVMDYTCLGKMISQST